MELVEIVAQILGKACMETAISQFCNQEDGEPYQVWKIETPDGCYVLKKAKGVELSVYDTFFSKEITGAPRCFGSTRVGEDAYFLMEYVSGTDLRVCSREKVIAALDALISLQSAYWERREFASAGYSYEASLPGRMRRLEHLHDQQLQRAYEAYLQLYASLPLTLCHDDLLPFNVLYDGEKATIIDWEYAGLLPYPTALARLLAHCQEQEDAFFYMTQEDHDFAVEYYYTNLVQHHGISYQDYRKALDACLLYEYCEWIMLGNRYPEVDRQRYQFYLEKAKAHVQHMYP